MPIRDQHQFRKLDAELRAFKSLRFLKPVLKLLGPKGREAARQFDDVFPKIESDFRRIRETPDRFNELFGPRSWVASKTMKLEIAEEAIRVAESQGIEAGEAVLEDRLNENIDGMMMQFLMLPQIQPRRRLISLAMKDHQEGRYHASVPVLLSQIDGIVFDSSHGKPFFEKSLKKTEHLQARNIVVGDPSGLQSIARMLSRGKKGYRHGVEWHPRPTRYPPRARPRLRYPDELNEVSLSTGGATGVDSGGRQRKAVRGARRRLVRSRQGNIGGPQEGVARTLQLRTEARCARVESRTRSTAAFVERAR